MKFQEFFSSCAKLRQSGYSWLIAGMVMIVLAGCAGNPASARTPELSELEQKGKSVFKSYCSACHATSPDEIIVGPSMAGIASRAEERMPGTGGREYIELSIREPGKFTVEGFPENIMPADLADQISAEEMEALIAYLLTLK